MIVAQLRVLEDAFVRNRVTVVRGHARFVDPRTVVVEENGGTRTVTADRIVIAVNDRTVFTTDTLRHLKQLPQSFLVVGGGVIGAELVSTLAALGVQRSGDFS